MAKESEGRLNVFLKLSYPDYRQIWLNCFIDDRHFSLLMAKMNPIASQGNKVIVLPTPAAPARGK